MTEKHLIGVDIGKQGTKAVLFTQSGIFKDLDKAAQQWSKTGHMTAPDPQMNGLYRERLNRYQEYIQTINAVNKL